jgi:hypothetical protein
VLVLGVICADGEPTVDEDGAPGCVGAASIETDVILWLPIATGGVTNRRPVIEADAARLDGAEWAPTTAATDGGPTGCSANTTLPHVVVRESESAAVEVDLSIAVRNLDREPSEAIGGDPPAPRQTRETLMLSSFTTAGELSTQFTFIEADDETTAPAAEVTWTAPDFDDIAPDGTRVRFTFVLRDGRGGLDWTTRALCAVRG